MYWNLIKYFEIKCKIKLRKTEGKNRGEKRREKKERRKENCDNHMKIRKEINQRCVYLKINSDISAPLFNLKFDANHKTKRALLHYSRQFSNS